MMINSVTKSSCSMRIINAFRPILKSIGEDRVFLNRDSHIIFVCGGQSEGECISARSRFISYANEHLNQYLFFQAEEVFDALTSKGHKSDLLSLEDRFAGFSDCIIIIIESAGSIAELGAFSIKDNIVKSILAINSDEHREAKSFISQGPLAKINKKSKFKPVIHMPLERILTVAGDIEERLKTLNRCYKKRINISSLALYKSSTPKIRMMLLADIIALAGPISFLELVSISKQVYPEGSARFSMELAMAKALKLIDEREGFLIGLHGHESLFFDYRGVNINSLKSDIFRSWRKIDRNRLSILKSRI